MFVDPEPDAYTVVGPDRKIEVDAYLFDARLHRDGQPTSFRLQLFQREAEISMSGRGYLGKGALKGRLTQDSLIAYFPSTNEFVRDATADLFVTDACPDGIPAPHLHVVLSALPDSSVFPAAVISVEEEDEKRYACVITWPQCDWSLQLEYDLRDQGWRLKRLDFETGEDSRFTLKRRAYKPQTKVKRSKIDFRIPDRATRVSP
jgi:hypothetical protein